MCQRVAGLQRKRGGEIGGGTGVIACLLANSAAQGERIRVLRVGCDNGGYILGRSVEVIEIEVKLRPPEEIASCVRVVGGKRGVEVFERGIAIAAIHVAARAQADE